MIALGNQSMNILVVLTYCFMTLINVSSSECWSCSVLLKEGISETKTTWTGSWKVAGNSPK